MSLRPKGRRGSPVAREALRRPHPTQAASRPQWALALGARGPGVRDPRRHLPGSPPRTTHRTASPSSAAAGLRKGIRAGRSPRPPPPETAGVTAPRGHAPLSGQPRPRAFWALHTPCSPSPAFPTWERQIQVSVPKPDTYSRKPQL
ncbi:uncharacterized protein LOC128931731 isoform X2 [Callithrix jacchus]